MSPHSRWSVARAAARPFVLALVLMTCLASAATASASTISGTAFRDTNADHVQNLDEAPMADHVIWLFTAGGGEYISGTRTDAAGHYAFSGMADGDYRVQYDSTTWDTLIADSVPTTTGSLRPQHDVHLAASAVADFGWRPLVRSTDVNAPISVYTGSTGLRVESFNDAVTAHEVYDATTAGLVGAEAPSVTIRFGYQNSGGGMTTTSTAQSGTVYTYFRAISWIPYVSWVQRGDQTLTHEYGHAWSNYFSSMVQQDDTFAGYLHARGLDGDSRIGSSYAWDVHEMIAEDFRQLFGTPNAQAADQINRDIQLAKDVAGLKTYLRDTFTQAPATSAPAPAPPPALTISDLAVSPTPVVRSANISFSLSIPATATLTILDAKGATVRTLLSAAAKPAGTVTAPWDRKDSAGRKVRSGTYTASARAVSSDGQSVTKTMTFTAS